MCVACLWVILTGLYGFHNFNEDQCYRRIRVCVFLPWRLRNLDLLELNQLLWVWVWGPGKLGIFGIEMIALLLCWTITSRIRGRADERPHLVYTTYKANTLTQHTRNNASIRPYFPKNELKAHQRRHLPSGDNSHWLNPSEIIKANYKYQKNNHIFTQKIHLGTPTHRTRIKHCIKILIPHWKS